MAVGILGVDNVNNPSAWSDFLQTGNTCLTVRWTFNGAGVVDGVTNPIRWYMWADSGTISAKAAVYQFNGGSGNLDKVVESSTITGITDAVNQVQSIVLPTANLVNGTVYHLAMYGSGDYWMKFFNPSLFGDASQTQSQETGLTFPVLPATILNSDLTTYGVTSSMWLFYNQTIPNYSAVRGVQSFQGVNSLTM